MDWSPFAVFASFPLLLIYSGLTVYVAACMVLAYKVTRTYARSDDWCCYQQCCCLPRWGIWAVTFLFLTVVFAVVILPVVFCLSAWVFVIEKLRRRYVSWRRGSKEGGGGGDANDAESGAGGGGGAAAAATGGGGSNDDAGSWTTIDTPVSSAPRDGQPGLDAPMDECAAEHYPGRPAPVYLQGRVYHDTLRG